MTCVKGELVIDKYHCKEENKENIGLPSSSHGVCTPKWVVDQESLWARVVEEDWQVHIKVEGEEEDVPQLGASQIARRLEYRG